MKTKILAVCAIGLLALASAGAAAFWEGTAVASSYGEFPQAGLYGTCSSFPRNTLVEVQNLENGKTVQVLVTDGLDNPGVFISLSPEASYELGIIVGMVARVRVSMPRRSGDTALRSDVPGANGDPDLNPAALVSRERAKRGVAVAEPSPAPTPFVTLRPSPTAKPSPAPAFTPSAERPEALAEWRKAPGGKGVAKNPGDLPVLSPEPAVAVATPAPSLAPSPKASLAPLERPEALVYEAGNKRAERAKAFALKQPLLEKMVAADPVESVEAYERVGMKPPAGKAPLAKLAEPGLSDRERPEAGFERQNAPEARKLAAVDLPDAALEVSKQTGEGIAGAEELPEAVALERPERREAEAVRAALALPRYEEVEHEAADVIAFEAPERREGSPLVAALARPELIEVADESAEAIALARARAKDGGIPIASALVDPEWIDETDAPEAYERLAASARSGAGVETALIDPDIELGEEERAVAEERLKASKREGLAYETGVLPDPEEEVVALVKTEDMPPEAIALERKNVKARAARGLDVALADPQAPSGIDEGSIPQDDAAVAYSGRLEPGAGAADPRFAKADPLLAPEGDGQAVAAVEQPAVGGADTVATVTLIPSEARHPSLVGSTRKSAEAVKLEKAGAIRADGLSTGTYYVQIGVFGSALGARDALDAMSRKYPMTYQEYETSGKRMMRLYVGPLKKDEGGLVLYQVKSLGYKDAFLKMAD